MIPGGSVVVQGDKITAVKKLSASPATYDLKGMTLLPGLIDSHAHVMWYFNRQGRLHQGGRNGNDQDTPVESMLSGSANAYAMSARRLALSTSTALIRFRAMMTG